MDVGKLLGPGFNAGGLLYPSVSVFEIGVRTFVVYLLLLIGIRVFSPRALSPLSPFDFVLVLVLSNAVQNAMTGGDNSLTGGIVAAGVLFVSNLFLNRTLYQHPWFKKLLVGRDMIIIHNGQMKLDIMRRVGIDEDELRRAAQDKGFESLSEVGEAIWEANGNIAFFAPGTSKVSKMDERKDKPAES